MNLKKRLIKYFEKDEIHEDKIYNVCVEITVQSDDILKKKYLNSIKQYHALTFYIKLIIFLKILMINFLFLNHMAILLIKQNL